MYKLKKNQRLYCVLMPIFEVKSECNIPDLSRTISMEMPGGIRFVIPVFSNKKSAKKFSKEHGDRSIIELAETLNSKKPKEASNE